MSFDHGTKLYTDLVRHYLSTNTLTSILACAPDGKASPRATKAARLDWSTSKPRSHIETRTVPSGDLHAFVESLVDVDAGDRDGGLLAAFVDKMTSEADDLTESVVVSLWIPMLPVLASKLETRDISLSSAIFQKLVTSILRCFVKKHTGGRPEPHGSLVRSPVSCACGLCKPLNVFLESPTEEKMRFDVTREDGMHIETKLIEQRTDCEIRHQYWEGHVMFVTKAANMWERKMQDWNRRVSEARKFIATSVGDDILSKIGDHEKLTGLPKLEPGQSMEAATEVVPLGEASLNQGVQPLQTSRPLPIQIAGKKRSFAIAGIEVLDTVND